MTGKEFKEVYAWTEQPTKSQAEGSGARDIETVIKFDTITAFEEDRTVNKKLRKNAVVSTRPAPISVKNVEEVGFKKEKRWWEIWKK